jgi:hypothetical protein
MYLRARDLLAALTGATPAAAATASLPDSRPASAAASAAGARLLWRHAALWAAAVLCELALFRVYLALMRERIP